MQMDENQALYTHSRRPRWGLAILAWEGEGERHYQFQDGQIRTFKQGYYELLEEVEAGSDRALDVIRDLKAMLRVARGRQSGAGASAPVKLVTFDEQLRVFESLFPGGFSDPAWLSAVRGAGEKRRKCHRDATIQAARAELAVEVLEGAIERDPSLALRALTRVLAATDLVGSKDSGALRRSPREHHADLARAIRDVLWGTAPYAERLGRYLTVLRRTPERVTWPLATAPAALVHPDEHVVVKPSLVRQQALWMALPTEARGRDLSAGPSPDLYRRAQAMMIALRERLARAGHAPRDLLDVHDFVRVTLEPRRPRSPVPASP